MAELETEQTKPQQSPTGRAFSFSIGTLLVLTFIASLVTTLLRPLRELLPPYAFFVSVGYCLALTVYGVLRLNSVFKLLGKIRKQRLERRHALSELIEQRRSEKAGGGEDHLER